MNSFNLMFQMERCYCHSPQGLCLPCKKSDNFYLMGKNPVNKLVPIKENRNATSDLGSILPKRYHLLKGQYSDKGSQGFRKVCAMFYYQVIFF